METENTVSIWIGNFNTKLQLDTFINFIYDDDGEEEPSQFYKQYNIDIDDIDDYLIEKEVFDMKHFNLLNMLKGASYEDEIIANIKKNGIEYEVPSSNSIILIYNYKYTGNILETEDTKFIGTVKYK